MTQHRIVIRRGHKGTPRWFIFQGERYIISQGSDTPTQDGSRYIAKVTGDGSGDWEIVAEGFGYMSEIQEFINRALDEGWTTLKDDSPIEYAGPASHHGR